MRWSLWVVATVVVCSFAGQAASAPTPTSAQLLARYAPILVLHPDERFQPEEVDGYLADADLVAGHYDQRLCKSIDGTAALDCYASADAAHAQSPAMYGAVFRRGNRIALEYWLFYAFDLFQIASTPPLDQFWQDHEADWEAVTVVLDGNQKPLYVGTSRHCGGARRDWARVQKRDRHPVVYVALGSHANYFTAGEPALDRSCWPKVALAIYDAYKVPLRDRVAVGATISPQVVPITATSPKWMTFSGAWGETQYVHFPNNAPFAFGLGPKGPAFHASWRKPVATVLGWPRG